MVRKLIYAYLPEWGWMWGLKWLYGYQPTVEQVSDSQLQSSAGAEQSIPTVEKRYGTDLKPVASSGSLLTGPKNLFHRFHSQDTPIHARLLFFFGYEVALMLK